MRHIEDTNTFIIFSCGKTILVCHKGDNEANTLHLPSSDTTPPSEPKALCIKLSSDEKYLAVACESKVVTVWCTQSWTLKYTHKLVKRPVSVDITSDSATLFVADKTGDVYHYPLLGEALDEKNLGNSNLENKVTDEDEDEEAESTALLGHLSMLLDLAVTSDRRYIITCDRDEKIRVSRYPNAYNIESFCLGHTEFVTQIDILPGKDALLLSCSGDGTIKLWNYLNGRCLSSTNTRDHTATFLQQFEEYYMEKVKDSEEAKRFLPDHPAVKHFAVLPSKGDVYYIAVIVDRTPALFMYKIEKAKLQHISTLDMKETTPLVAHWLTTGELLVEQNSTDAPIGIFTLQQDLLIPVNNHQLIDFSKRHKERFSEGKKELAIDILYKQRYDNVADYLKKKQERLESAKAVEAGLVPSVKKGRWV